MSHISKHIDFNQFMKAWFHFINTEYYGIFDDIRTLYSQCDMEVSSNVLIFEFGFRKLPHTSVFDDVDANFNTFNRRIGGDLCEYLKKRTFLMLEPGSRLSNPSNLDKANYLIPLLKLVKLKTVKLLYKDVPLNKCYFNYSHALYYYCNFDYLLLYKISLDR